MIINSETLDEILTNVSNSFLECESVQEICQLYIRIQLMNKQNLLLRNYQSKKKSNRRDVIYGKYLYFSKKNSIDSPRG